MANEPTYVHGQLSHVSSIGDVTVMYPEVTTDDIVNGTSPISIDKGGTGATDKSTAYKNISTTVITTANTILDNYKSSGWYYFSATYVPSDSPAGTSTGYLYVINASDSTITQIWFNRNDNKIYTRVYNGSSVCWSTWREYKLTDTTYSAATTSTAGLMSAADKTKLDGIATGANKITVDSSLSSTSTNPVQNKVINTALSGKANTSHTHSVNDITDTLPITKGGTGATDKSTAYTNLSMTVVNTANTLLDNYMNAGWYYFSASYVPSDSPAGTSTGYLNVIYAAASTITQMWFNRNDNKIYTRVYNGSGTGWAAWREYKLTDTTYSAATTSTAGLMSAADKTKLDGIATGAKTGTITSVTTGIGLTGGSITTTGTIKTNLKSETPLTNDSTASGNTANRTYAVAVDKSGYLAVNVPWSNSNTTYTLTQDATDGHKITLTPSSGTATTITIPDNDTTYSNATTSASGLMSASDKTKLDGIATGANKITIDSSLSSTSTNPVQNKVINSALSNKLNTSLKGVANGLAELDSSGKVPSSQLPAYVDDVIDGYYKNNKFYSDSDYNTEITGESGKIYINLTDNKTYRWSGSTYVVISETLALGETSSTAYSGDKGKIAYDHSQLTSGNPHNVTKTDIGLSNVENKSSATIRGELTKSNVTTALGYTPPTTDTTYSNATTSTAGLMSSTDKSRVDDLYKQVGGYGVTDGTSTAYTTNISGITLTHGTVIFVRFNIANGANATLNVNSLGAKPIYYKDAAITANIIPAQTVVALVYDNVRVDTGTWRLVYSHDSNTTYKNMTAATASAAGKAGLVPAPGAGKNTSFLRGDGTWVVPTDTTYSVATTSIAGLMSSDDKTKLDGIDTNANKITVDSSLSSTSTNPVQNKVINSALASKSDTSHTHTVVNGHTVESDVPANAKFTDTTYSAGTGISLSGTTFTNSGVRSISTGTTNGTISVNTNGTSANVAVKGLGTAAYTSSTTYATASHTHSVSDITDTLPIEKGGTGKTTNGEAYQNLAMNFVNTTGTSMDDYTTPGWYYLSGSYIPNDAPLVTASYVYVYTCIASTINQIWFNKDMTKIYSRVYTNEAWTTWTELKFTDTTYSNMTAATASAAGKAGLVPAPAAGKQTSFLRGDGTWVVPTNTNTTYTLTQDASDGHKITLTPSSGTATTITIPDNDTTYSNATTSTAGLMSATDKTKLDGIATGANKITVDSTLSSSSTNPVQNKVINSALSSKSDTSHTHTVVNGHTVESDVPANAKFTDTTYSVATTSASGLMSASDKTSLDNLTSRIAGYGVTDGTNSEYTLSISGVALTHGTVIFVRFNVANVANATLNVNSLGAKPIYYKDAAITAGIIPAQTVVGLVYDNKRVNTGTWRLIYSYDSNTTYSAATTSTAGLMSASDKTKLDGIDTNANKITVDSTLSSSSTNPVQNKVINSALSSKSDTSHTHTVVNGHTVESDVPANAKFTDTTYSNMTAATSSTAGTSGLVPAPGAGKQTSFLRGDGTWVVPTNTNTTYTLTQDANDGHKITLTPSSGTATTITIPDNNTTYSAATTSTAGLMSASDKTKLDGIDTNANKITVDSTLSSSSTNPVQNKVINSALSSKSDTSHTHTVVNGHTVESDVPANAKFTDTTYSDASTSAHGLMTAADKTTLNNLGARIAGYGVTSGTNTAYTLSISGVALTHGTVIFVRFNIANGANATLNVNSLGAKPIYYKNAAITANIIPAQTVVALVYDNVRVDTGTWRLVYSHDSNTTYSVATTSASGLMSASDKTKLDGIDTNANKITVDSSLSSSSTNPVQNKVINSALSGKSDTSHTHTVVNGHTVESDVPANAKFTDTTYSNMTAATSSAAGKAGLVPAPAAGKQASFLRGDGTWVVPTNSNTTYTLTQDANDGHKITLTPSSGTATTITIPDNDTTYSNATTSASGLMSASDKTSLDNLTSRIAGYDVTGGTTSAYTISISGVALTHGTVIFVRFNAANAANATLNVNNLGAKPIYYKDAAITDNIIPAQTVVALVYDNVRVTTGTWRLIYSYNANTTYSAATTSTAGLMSASDKTKLDGIDTNANKITVDSELSSTSNNPVQNNVINTALSNKANTSHTHSVSDITDTLPITKGGTGATTNSEAYQNLAMNFVNTTGTSMDDYITSGWYYLSGSYIPSDAPVATASYVYVYTCIASTVNQIWFNKAMTKIYTRAYSSSAWGEWTELKFTDTTYSDATTSAHGLMTAADKTTLNNLGARIAGYGVTGGTTSAYTITISGITLTHGTVLFVRFNAANAAGATLNVNSLGAKPIYYKDAAITANIIPAQTVVALVYDNVRVTTGTWRLIYSYNANTTYSAMTAATASAAGKAGLVPAPAAGKNTAFLRGDATWVDSIPIASGGTGATTSQQALQNLTFHLPADSGTNLDDYRGTDYLGYWYFGADYIPTNTPVNTTGYLVVIRGGGSLCKQIWLTQGSTSNHQDMYVRTYSNSTWLPWVQINITPTDKAKLDDIPLGRASGSTAGYHSVALGRNNNIASANDSIAIGHENNVTATSASAIGYKNTVSGNDSGAIGNNNTVSAESAFSVGTNNNISRSYATAIGYNNDVDAVGSIAVGRDNTISYNNAYCSAAIGWSLTNNSYTALVCGRNNKTLTANNGTNMTTGDIFVIGNGASNIKSNAFRVTYAGGTYANGSYNNSGADYAEFVKPWADGNPTNEDRVGYMVTVKDGKLYKANEGDYIIGITSGNPSVIGNSDEDYYWRYERDEFNRRILDENNNFKLSENYDPNKPYVERKNRAEWDYVGMRGIIPVRDDGTCEAGGFCKCGTDGIATKSERGLDTYFVIERINDHVISVEVK